MVENTSFNIIIRRQPGFYAHILLKCLKKKKKKC